MKLINSKQNRRRRKWTCKCGNGEIKSTFTHDLHAKIITNFFWYSVPCFCTQYKIHLFIYSFIESILFICWMIFNSGREKSGHLEFGILYASAYHQNIGHFSYCCILISGIGLFFYLVICSALEFINKYKIGIHVKHGVHIFALFINKIQTFHFCHHRLFNRWISGALPYVEQIHAVGALRHMDQSI